MGQSAVIAELAAAVDALCDAEPSVVADGESIVELHRLRARLDAAATRAVAAFDAEGVWRADGAKTAAAWLAGRCRTPLAAARRQVRLGRKLRHMPVTEVAWLAGEVEVDHVNALARARTAVTEDDFARDEKVLVDAARDMSHRKFLRVLDYWRQHADPDGREDDAAAVEAGRTLHMSQSFDGVWFGDFRLDPIRGTVVHDTLGRIEQEMFAEEWAEARERLGRDPKVEDLARSPAQRRADALVEMARRARTAPEGGRRPEPLFTVLVGYESFAGRICELADGTVVTPGSLVRYLDEAWVERVVFDGPSRVIDVGVARRCFEGATRRAVEVRDRECFHDLCEQPAETSQIDHVLPYAAGGPTTQANGRAGCGFHNRGRHRRP